MTRAFCLLLLFAALALGACRNSPLPTGTTPGGSPLAEVECPDQDSLRRPLFGDLHVHTRYSWDAVTFGNENGPRESYVFARGGDLAQPPAPAGEPPNLIRLRRPLDFAAVTDHSEGFGFVGVCTDPESPGYDAPECQALRGEGSFPEQLRFIFTGTAVNNPTGPLVCQQPGVDCEAADGSLWRDIQLAAAQANTPCAFTSFVGYEWTQTELEAHLHRNVLFRNERVPVSPVSVLDTGSPDFGIGAVQMLWRLLGERCVQAIPGCEVLTIPHNSNLSRGRMFTDPVDAQEAADRQVWEPLIEIHQHKGNSECHFNARFGRGVDTTDELCDYEQLPRLSEFIPPDPVANAIGRPPPEAYSPRAFARSALKDGLKIEQQGLPDLANPTQLAHINPFKLGFIGSTDTHSAAPGATDEDGWAGHQAVQDGSAERRLASRTLNPGGLAVVWAEQNTRDSIFAALRRRETYGTSGTRPTVRFFGGWGFDASLCRDPELVEKGYQSGVPMGSDLPVAPAGAAAPTFVAWALQDAGTRDFPGNALQRLQIVKGWVDALGATHEQVFDVAPAAPADSRTVDPATCRAPAPGSSQLCTVWADPAFDPARPAFYYLRVLEDPSCHWSVHDCRAVGVDPFAAACDTSSANPYAACCAANTDPVTQERAWASPIWYRPKY